MVFGGMIGTTSGVAAGLAATDPKLVHYGALTATFYTGLGVLVCPSVFYLLVRMVFGLGRVWPSRQENPHRSNHQFISSIA